MSCSTLNNIVVPLALFHTVSSVVEILPMADTIADMELVLVRMLEFPIQECPFHIH